MRIQHSDSIEISFLGGAGSIGASCTLVRVAGTAFVVDCGVRYSGSSPLPDLSRLAASDLPVSLEGALKARRSRLGPRTRAILERAAVVGEVFWDEVVLALGRGDTPRSETNDPAQIWPDDSETMSLEDGIRYERDLFCLCFSSEDKEEGVAAFLDKRPAEWKGR